MYCPKCGTHNIDNAKFCRSCGTSKLELVTQALESGSSEPVLTKADEQLRSKATESALTSIFLGLAFLIVAAVFWRRGWGIWMIFPGMGLLAKGIAGAISLKAREYGPPPAPPENRYEAFESRGTGELPQDQPQMIMPPPSVTEGTTRNLDPVPRERDKA